MSKKVVSKNQVKPGQISAPEVDVGVKPIQYITIGAGSPKQIDGEVVDEAFVCISVNGEELATFMCSPTELKEMAVGFLYNEGIIENLEEVRTIHISKQNSCVDVWLREEEKSLPQRRIITAGCGGGVTFDDLSTQHEPLNSDLRITPEELTVLMRQMHMGAKLYHRARGIHTAALGENNALTLQVEDVGRHNCLDKLAGAAFLNGLQTENQILLSSGRISSEMINKARRLKTPIICSRTSPTSLSVALAEEWNITIVAYLRKNRMRVYTHQERLIG